MSECAREREREREKATACGGGGGGGGEGKRWRMQLLAYIQRSKMLNELGGKTAPALLASEMSSRLSLPRLRVHRHTYVYI